MINESNQRLMNILRQIVIGLAGLSVCTQLVSLWMGLNMLDTEWTIMSTYRGAASILSFDQYVLYHLALRLLVLAIFWFGVIVLLVKKPVQAGGLLAALTLAALPHLVLLGEMRSAYSLINPLLALAANLRLSFGVLGLFLLIMLYLSFPGWCPAQRWLIWLTFLLVGGFAVLVFLTAIQIVTEAWGIMVLLLLSALALGIGVQIYRLSKLPVSDRKQTLWVVVAMISLPVTAALVSLGIFDQGLGALIAGHVQVLIWALPPLAIAEAAVRRGLWGAVTFSQRAPTGIFLLLLVGVLLAFYPLAQRYRDLHTVPAISQAAVLESATGELRPVVIDTDMAQDDWLAVLFMLNRPDVEVKAILVDGTGEAHCEPGVRHALSLVALAGKSGIPVTCGRETPLQGSSTFPEEWRQDVDNLGGLHLPAGQNPPGVLPGSAVDLLIDVVNASPAPVTILTLGPLTNLAESVQKDAGWQSNVQQVFIMGGALTVPGNVGFIVPENQEAEWNLFVDPLAVQIVFTSGLPITLVPLDATRYVPVTVDFYRTFQANMCTPSAQFAGDVLASLLTGDGLYFWDGLTAALLVNEHIGVIQEGRVTVETEPLARQAVTRLSADGDVMRYASRANDERFAEEFIQTYNLSCPTGDVK